MWLTAARFIIRFRRLKEKITEQDHIDVINEHEEFWRNKYATLLAKNKENINLAYLMPSGKPYDAEVVHRDSIGIVFYFARWPEDNDDKVIPPASKRPGRVADSSDRRIEKVLIKYVLEYVYLRCFHTIP